MKAARSIQKVPVRILAEAAEKALKPETAWVAAQAAAQEGAGARKREAILAAAVRIQSQAFLKQRAVPEEAARRQSQVVLKQRTAPMINLQRPVRKLLSEPGRRRTVRQPET